MLNINVMGNQRLGRVINSSFLCLPPKSFLIKKSKCKKNISRKGSLNSLPSDSLPSESLPSDSLPSESLHSYLRILEPLSPPLGEKRRSNGSFWKLFCPLYRLEESDLASFLKEELSSPSPKREVEVEGEKSKNNRSFWKQFCPLYRLEKSDLASFLKETAPNSFKNSEPSPSLPLREKAKLKNLFSLFLYCVFEIGNDPSKSFNPGLENGLPTKDLSFESLPYKKLFKNALRVGFFGSLAVEVGSSFLPLIVALIAFSPDFLSSSKEAVYEAVSEVFSLVRKLVEGSSPSDTIQEEINTIIQKDSMHARLTEILSGIVCKVETFCHESGVLNAVSQMELKTKNTINDVMRFSEKNIPILVAKEVIGALRTGWRGTTRAVARLGAAVRYFDLENTSKL